MSRDTTKPGLRIVHAGTAEAKKVLQPIGKTVYVTQQAKELLEDFRLEACAYGAATTALEIERRWMNMQMRFHELTEYMSKLEQESSAYRRDGVMQF